MTKPNPTREIEVDEVLPPNGRPADPGQAMREAAEKLGADNPISKFISYILDECIRIPGTKFRIGLDPIMGLVPGIGDSLSAFIGTFIIGEAYRKGVAPGTQLKMAVNVLINAGIGAIPVFGDVFSAWFRSNTKNYQMLAASERQGQTPRRPRSKWMVALFMSILLAIVAFVFIGVWSTVIFFWAKIKALGE